MKRVLITGIGGFVGHHAAEHFLKNTDWEIVGIDSWRHKGDSLRLRHLIGSPDYSRRLKIFTHDLAVPISTRLQEELGPIDYLLNIASESHVDRSITDPIPFVLNNVGLALTIGEYVREVKPAALIHCSTDEVFGPALDGYCHKEEETHRPSNPYAASKAAQEDIFLSYWRCFGIPYIRTNCMNMIGERQDPEKFVPLCIAKIVRGETITIHGSPEQVGSRMYLHARNLSDAWLYIFRNCPATPYDPTNNHTVQGPDSYNIVGEQELSNLGLANLIGTILKRPVNVQYQDFHAARPGHDRRYALDGSKIKTLGWSAPFSFERSLEKLVTWTVKPENAIWLR